MSTRCLVLYSTNTWLAWAIAERYYHGIHWVWCSPFFRDKPGLFPVAMPPTAIPGKIYDELASHVAGGGDHHSPYIKANKVGILDGARHKKEAGVIKEAQHAQIVAIVERSGIRDFRPILYVIPFRSVSRRLLEVPPADRAHAMSIEYRIEQLPRSSFDVIELRGSDV